MRIFAYWASIIAMLLSFFGSDQIASRGGEDSPSTSSFSIGHGGGI